MFLAGKVKMMKLIFGIFFLFACSAHEYYASDRFLKRDDTGTNAKVGYYGGERQSRSQIKNDATGKERFFLGSRYGKRSGEPTATVAPDDENVSSSRLGRSWSDPSSRNDAFFLGSRYGKRADGDVTGFSDVILADVNRQNHQLEGGLHCTYTGYGNLCFCSN